MLTHDMLANQRTTGDADGGTAAAARAAAGPDRLLTAVAERQDHLAFAQLFERFAPRIEAWLRRRGAAAPLAEDVAQDVMLALWQRAAQFELDPGDRLDLDLRDRAQPPDRRLSPWRG